MGSRRRGRIALLAGLAALVAVLVGGGLVWALGVDDEPFTLPVGDPAYDAAAPAWAVGGEIHVGEDVIAVDPAPEAFVVTDAGIHYLADGVLWFTDGGPAEEVATVRASHLSLSPDGRLLGLLDRGHGPRLAFGDVPAVPVVLDVGTGEQVLRIAAPDDAADEDLGDLYGELPPYFLGFDDEAAYVADPLREGTTRIALDDGSLSSLPDHPRPRVAGPSGTPVTAAPAPGDRIGYPEDPDAGVLIAYRSPAGDVVYSRSAPRVGLFDADSGERVRFDPGAEFFELGGWLDDDTFFGAASSSSADGAAGRTRIVTCEVSGGACAPVSDTFQLPEEPTLLFETGEGAWF
ncbi:hypothetical protein [Nocardioides donggukensis]|uniref:Uncharacterized protein n=1 Tax=Nocardioides donggukensis TaxID=2774019 RepID=A0A927K2B1_9ACTN|nr:hypothetical protein [Nocardioides donggukensis]MBD8868128.1 hypothetical protein [Nocardioides donggukensis]